MVIVRAIVTITADSGNLTKFTNHNIHHASVNTGYSTGVLECNIASQSITHLSDMFRSEYKQKFPWIERFEYIGTCNVTHINGAFKSSGIKYFKATVPNATNGDYMFQSSTIEFLHGKVGSSGSCPADSVFRTTPSLKGIPSTFDLSGFKELSFYGSDTPSVGTVDNPVTIKDGITNNQIFRAAPYLREVNIASGYFNGNQTSMFYQSKNLTAVRGLNGTAITSLSNAFYQTYSKH